MKVIVVYEFDTGIWGVFSSMQEALKTLRESPEVTFKRDGTPDGGKYNFLYPYECEIDGDITDVEWPKKPPGAGS